MLGYAHNRQPTSECLDMCTAVNHDPARVSVKYAISVTSVISCGFIKLISSAKIISVIFFTYRKLIWNYLTTYIRNDFRADGMLMPLHPSPQLPLNPQHG